jgi:hypothetical protein
MPEFHDVTDTDLSDEALRGVAAAATAEGVLTE